jgi:nucleoside 2-deoxyribosyltransferase
LFASIRAAAECAGLAVVQSIDAADESIYTPNAIRAVRSATILIADCTLQAESRKPDSDVMFQIGAAMALGKSVIVVTAKPASPHALFFVDRSRVVEFEPGEVNAVGQFVATLSEVIKERLSRQRSALIEDDHADINVAYTRVVQMRTTFWENYERILRFATKMQQAFGATLPNVHDLVRAIETLYHDVTKLENDSHLERDRCEVARALLGFKSAHEKHLAGLLESASNEWPEIESVLDRMKSKFSDQMRHQTQNATGYFRLIWEAVDGYCDVANLVLAEAQADPARDMRQSVLLRTHVLVLSDFVEQSRIHLNEMLDYLLDLIRNGPLSAESRDDIPHAHIPVL